MCSPRHPQYRWDDRRIQLRPDHGAGGNSERETEDASPPSNTPRVETTPIYGATRSDATPTPVAPPPRTRKRKQKDQGTPEPMFPTQETATSAETALSQGEHQGPYPTMVKQIADLIRKPQKLMKRQKEDSHLLGKVQDLNNGGTGGDM